MGRFISADTVVPGAEEPQALNRYAYVLNSPLKYTDPSGHTPLLVTAFVGAGIGAVVNIGVQVASIMDANQGSLSLEQAIQQVDLGQVAGAAVAGGVMGLTLGMGSAMLGTRFWATTYLGMVGGGLGGQAGAITEASWNAGVRLLNGAGFDGTRFLNEAQEYGFLNLTKWGLDCTAGAISAGAGHQLTQFLGNYLNIPMDSEPDIMKTIVRLDLQKGEMFIQVTDFGKSLRFPLSQSEQLMQYITNVGYEVSEGFLEELLQTGVAEWIENQID